ncbi:UPF0746 protein DDB_G0281095-like [Anastrepha ludens]|uniref:UPF0746 protein DDB_G0281095-like n=1 Tax=Anastrepha ludens TaxID=28586 RepID=UPI0023B0994C|nr:UPF0746 protein DDB_G0281095-like [Anastrepha ludens]
MLAFHNEHIASCAFLTYFSPESTTTAANSPTMPQAAALNDKSALTGIATTTRPLVADDGVASYSNGSTNNHCSGNYRRSMTTGIHNNNTNSHCRRLQPYFLGITRLRLQLQQQLKQQQQQQQQKQHQQHPQQQQQFNSLQYHHQQLNNNNQLRPMQLSATQPQRRLLHIVQLQQMRQFIRQRQQVQQKQLQQQQQQYEQQQQQEHNLKYQQHVTLQQQATKLLLPVNLVPRIPNCFSSSSSSNRNAAAVGVNTNDTGSSCNATVIMPATTTTTAAAACNPLKLPSLKSIVKLC